MKRRILIIMVALCSMMSCNDGVWDAIHGLEDKYNDLDGRLSKVEELCKEMNTNISALQTLVSVMLNNDYIVSIVPIMKEDQEIGYTITFAIQDPITIYHGQNGQNGKDGQDGKDGENGKDGKDGQDGQDGADGVTPIISVALDPSDNAYYWTLNGDWLLDAQGNRIPLTSKDGKDGKDGTDGNNGKDGITPQLKIEDNYWYVSTDNGQTWTKLGKAVGEDGKDGENGKDGKDGEDGDSMFQSITIVNDHVAFLLANGVTLHIPLYRDDTVKIVDGAIMAEFSVSKTKNVYFSMGNLRKQQNSQTGEDEYFIAEAQDLPLDSSYWFTWSTYGEHPIVNSGNNTWRALNHLEWEYLINNHMYIFATVVNANDTKVYGAIIFPNNYQPIPYSSEVSYTIYSNLWTEWQKNGAIFISISDDNYEYATNYKYHYWANDYASYTPYYLCSGVTSKVPQLYVSSSYPSNPALRGLYRLVKDVE